MTSHPGAGVACSTPPQNSKSRPDIKADISCLHVGVDGLDVAFQGALPQHIRDVLREARDRAQAIGDPVKIELGGLAMQVFDTGARGGYRYRMDTGDDGETWFVKDGGDATDWNLRVSCKSLPLATYGYAYVRDRLYERLEAMGATVIGESVGRVDICADFLMPKDFELEPSAFVAHSQSTRDAHGADDGDRAWSSHYIGRRCSSVTIGRMPGRQLIVYDKRAEATKFRKWHWFDLWQRDRKDRTPIWRVEVRAGKRWLKDWWKVTTFQELDAALGDMVATAMQQVRLTDPTDPEKNPTRRALHPLWREAAAHLGDAVGDRAGLVPERRMVTGRRSVVKEMFRGQLFGLAASYAAVCQQHDPDALVEQLTAEMWTRIAEDPDAWHSRVQKAEDRQELMEDEHGISDGGSVARSSCDLRGGRPPGQDAGGRRSDAVRGQYYC